MGGSASTSTSASTPYIRVHSWFKSHPLAKRLQGRSRAGKPKLLSFVPIRVHSWFKKHPSRSPCRADLGLESPSYFYSCPFVFIRGSKNTPREVAFRADLGLESPSYFHSCPFVSIRGSKHPSFVVQNTARKEKPSKLIASKVHLCSKVSQALAVSSARFSGEPPVSLNLPSLSQGDSRVSGSQAETTFALERHSMQPLCQRQKSRVSFSRKHSAHTAKSYAAAVCSHQFHAAVTQNFHATTAGNPIL